MGQPTFEQVMAALGSISEERGWLTGAPIPSLADTDHKLVIARRAPLAEYRTLTEEEFGPGDAKIVNSWTGPGHDVMIVEDDQGRLALRMPHQRLRMLIDSTILRHGAVTLEAEMKAFICLAERLSQAQLESYVLSGAFAETGRSGV